MRPLFQCEESRVWLQTRRILDRKQTPRLALIQSTAPPEQVEEWMHDEIRRYRIVEQMFREQRR